jgi:alkylation response protein AidB-like acyl-CoA dehydrogenase
MSADLYPFDLRDLQFGLFEHLQIQKMFELEPYKDFDRESVDMLLAEGVRFAQKVLAACNRSGDDEGCTFDNGVVKVPAAFHEAYRKQYEAGWMATTTDPDWGGQGLPYAVGIALGEAFVGANCSLSMVAGLTRGAADLIIRMASDELKQKYVPKMISGEWQGTMCLTEPHAGTAVGSLHTTASRRDGKYFLRGQKIFISGGEHDLVKNVIHLVLARVEGAPAGTKGLSLFLVPKYHVNADGSLGPFNDVQCVGIEHKLGINGSPTCAMSFGDSDQCEGFLIGQEQQGMELMFQLMNYARIGTGLQGVALGSAAYLFALEYARTRIQGSEMKNFRDPNAPQVPIIKHPDVRRMLLTMKAFVEGGRALLLHTAWALDYSEHGTDEAEREHMLGRVELLTPLCKAWCSDTGFEVTALALQTLGGHGYLRDYPIEQHLRDAKIASIYEGANGIQAIDLIGRKLGRKQGMYFMQLMSDIGAFIDTHREHPQLGTHVAQLALRKEKMEQIAMGFAMKQMSGDLDMPLLSATGYLRMMSNVIVGWLLLEQAVVAQAALDKLCSDRNAVTPEARLALCTDHDDARFYDNKVKTAQFFATGILPQNDGLAATIELEDRSALEVLF